LKNALKRLPGKIPSGLARVRKEIPPPGKVFESKKSKQGKAELRRQLMEVSLRQFS
jgi:hypothetical protein